MPAKPGRPARVAMRRWINDDAYLATITSIIKSRDKTNEETLTNVDYALEVLARETVPVEALIPRRLNTLRRLARYATPSFIARTLVSWRLGLEDRILRETTKRSDLKNIPELCWA